MPTQGFAASESCGRSGQSHRSQPGNWRRAPLTADKGYFAVEELPRSRVRHRQNRETRTLPASKEASAVRCGKLFIVAACAVKSESGKALLRKRGHAPGTSFSTSLTKADCAEPTLQGTEN